MERVSERNRSGCPSLVGAGAWIVAERRLNPERITVAALSQQKNNQKLLYGMQWRGQGAHSTSIKDIRGCDLVHPALTGVGTRTMASVNR